MNKNKGVANSAEEISPLLAGEEIPQLKLTTHDDKVFDLNAAVAQKPTRLIFYHGGWCPYCSLHLAGL